MIDLKIQTMRGQFFMVVLVYELARDLTCSNSSCISFVGSLEDRDTIIITMQERTNAGNNS